MFRCSRVVVSFYRVAFPVAATAVAAALSACIPPVSNDSHPTCNAQECLPVPQQAQAIGLNASIAVTWSAVSRASSYNVYYSTSPGVTPSSVGLRLSPTQAMARAGAVSMPSSPAAAAKGGGSTVAIQGVQSTAAVAPGLTNGTTYYAIVTEVNETTGVESLPSPQVSATPVPSGSADVSFGGTGAVSTTVGAGATGATVLNQAFAAVIDGQGRIIAVGDSKDALGNFNLAVWRYNQDGTPDTSFNGTGAVFSIGAAGGDPTFTGGASDAGVDVTLDSLGRIVITGTSEDSSTQGIMAIWRYNPDGSPDTSFNGTGYAVTMGASPGGFIEQGQSILIDSVGRILVLGYSNNGPGPWLVVWRYTSDGNPDLTFSDGACQTLYLGTPTVGGCIAFTNTVTATFAPINPVWDGGERMILDAAGNILVAGFSSDELTMPNASVWRLTPTGTLDLSFNSLQTPGYFTTGPENYGVTSVGGPAGSSGEVPTAIALDGSGYIYLVGSSQDASTNNHLVIWRLQPSGAVDTTLTDGTCQVQAVVGGCVATIAPGLTQSYGEGARMDAGGNLVITGMAVSGTGAGTSSQLGVWRYTITPPAPAAFAADTTFGSGSGLVLANNAALGPLVDPNGIRMGLYFDALGRIVVATNGQDNTGLGSTDLTIYRFVP